MRRTLLLLVAMLGSCASEREGWARRGRYRVLHESPTLQVRRGPQTSDPQTGEIVLAWIGVRTPEGAPELVACELTVYDDRDGDGAPAAGEIRFRRESRETSRKILFGDLRTRSGAPRAFLVASTARERCEVGWRLTPD